MNYRITQQNGSRMYRVEAGGVPFVSWHAETANVYQTLEEAQAVLKKAVDADYDNRWVELPTNYTRNNEGF